MMFVLAFAVCPPRFNVFTNLSTVKKFIFFVDFSSNCARPCSKGICNLIAVSSYSRMEQI